MIIPSQNALQAQKFPADKIRDPCDSYNCDAKLAPANSINIDASPIGNLAPLLKLPSIAHRQFGYMGTWRIAHRQFGYMGTWYMGTWVHGYMGVHGTWYMGTWYNFMFS